MTATAQFMTASPVTTTTAVLDGAWDTFRCRKCQRVLFKFDDGQKHRIEMVIRSIQKLDALVAAGAISVTERDELVAGYKFQRKIEIKCTLTACKTMNYLIESVR
jgi:phage FluMu protein Com